MELSNLLGLGDYMNVHYFLEEKICNYLLDRKLILYRKQPEKDDLFVHIGSGNTVFYINKITDPETGKSRYPEIMFRHPFDEREKVSHDTYILFCASREHFKPSNIYFFESPGHGRERIYNWINGRLAYRAKNANPLTKEEENLIELIAMGLNLTDTMRYDFKRCCVNKKIRDDDLYKVLAAYISAKAGSKKERSLIYNEIKSKLNFIDY